MSVTTRLETVTPRKAQQYLDNRASNRPVSHVYAARLANAMRNDEFEVNGETLKFDTNDKMIDGQHRCQAGVIANKPFKTFVTRGLNACTFDTIDTGNRRTIGHVFAKHGETNYNLLAGAVSWLWKFNEGHMQKNHQMTPRHPEALAVLREHPELRDSLVFGNKMKGLASPSAMSFLHYLFSRIDKDAADWFFDHLSSGENLSKSSAKTSAIYLLRARMQDNRASKEKLPVIEIIKLTIKAWSYYRSRRVVKTLRHRSAGNSVESFPEIEE